MCRKLQFLQLNSSGVQHQRVRLAAKTTKIAMHITLPLDLPLRQKLLLKQLMPPVLLMDSNILELVLTALQLKAGCNNQCKVECPCKEDLVAHHKVKWVACQWDNNSQWAVWVCLLKDRWEAWVSHLCREEWLEDPLVVHLWVSNQWVVEDLQWVNNLWVEWVCRWVNNSLWDNNSQWAVWE